LLSPPSYSFLFFFFLILSPPPTSTLFPYTTLFRSPRILRLGSVKDVKHFAEHVQSLALTIPCDSEIVHGAESPLLLPLVRGGIRIGNRIAVQPMEGWDGISDGKPSEHTIRRWRRFGQSGAKLIWG